MVRPAKAAIKMIIGSCIFLNLNNNNNVETAIITEMISVNCRFANTSTAPAIAPIAAAVTPSTKALIAGCLPYFLK